MDPGTNRVPRVARWVSMAILAAGVSLAAVLGAPAANERRAPVSRHAAQAFAPTAAGEKWFGGGAGGLMQTKHRDTGGDPKTRIVSDDNQAYRGTIDFKFTIDGSGSISGAGKGKYYEATWSLSGTNGDKGPIQCDPTITAKSFTVEVSGQRKNGVITLNLRLPDAEESSVDTPCPDENYTAYGGTTHRLDDSLALVGGRAFTFNTPVTGMADQYSVSPSKDEDKSGGDYSVYSIQHFWGITIGPDGFFSKKDKDALAKSSANLAIVAAGLAAYALKNPTALWATLGSAAYGINSAINNRLALDPPDRHFRAIPRPHPPRFPRVTAEGGLTQAAATSLNAFNANIARTIGFGKAVVSTVERAQGARRAKNKRWQRRQLKAARIYARKLAITVRANKKLRGRAKAALDSSGLSATHISAAEFRAFQQQVKTSGLPQSLNDTLKALGANAAFRADIRTKFLLLNPNDVAALTLPAMIDNATLTAALQAAAKALSDFSSSH